MSHLKCKHCHCSCHCKDGLHTHHHDGDLCTCDKCECNYPDKFKAEDLSFENNGGVVIDDINDCEGCQ
jgi:hypothetical protein|tara:strand:- start:280 stop:483 length:204 start_codon:yes stop_codon:yes gene_type:complete